MEFTPARPGSAGEHELQNRFGTIERANRFYSHQMLDYLNDRMQIFVGRQEMIFISTSDAHGECDCSFRAGPPGFVRVLDDKTITWPEYRGNGVLASAGNITENPHVGILMIDFVKDVIGLHVNGKAEMVSDEQMRQKHPWLIEDDAGGRSPERWIVVHVEEAYVHCSKHIPRMVRVPVRRSVGTGENRRELKRKGGDYFAARSSPSPWKEALDPDERQSADPGEAAEPKPGESAPTAVPVAEPVSELVGEMAGAADEAAEPEYDTCGLNLPDGKPAEVGAGAVEAGAVAEDDGPIWGELTTARHARPWDERQDGWPGLRDPLAAAAAAAAERSDGVADTDGEANEARAENIAWSPSSHEQWSPNLWSERARLADESENETDERREEHRAYVGTDSAATLLFGAGFDPYGSGSRRRERDEPDAG